MDERELIEFMAARKPSPHVGRKDASGLACYGCAHSAASEPSPGKPSGERPCCSCVRNPELEAWRKRAEQDGRGEAPILEGTDGNARTFDPFKGTLYNGAPRLYFPMDNYVTLDQHDQEHWLDEHPEYAKAVQVNGDRVEPVD